MAGRLSMLAIACGLVASPALAASLDPLLEGFEDACDYSDGLAALLQSSYAFARTEGDIAIPAGYETVFGQPTVAPVDEYLHVTLPVSDGTWRGVPVQEIEVFITALESGFSSHAVIFPAGAVKQAEETFKARGESAQTKLTAQDKADLGWQTGFSVVDGVPRYMCDLST